MFYLNNLTRYVGRRGGTPHGGGRSARRSCARSPGARRGAGAPAQRIDSRYARRVTRRATQPVGDTATCSLQIRTVRGGAKTGHRLRTEISDRFAALWQRNQLDDGPSSPVPTGSRYGER